MRTKTPKQIFEQWDRLSDALLLKSWNGKDYADARYNAMYDRIDEAADRYIDNIYKACGVENHLMDIRVKRCNFIWSEKAFPASVYTKQVGKDSNKQ